MTRRLCRRVRLGYDVGAGEYMKGCREKNAKRALPMSKCRAL